MSTLTTRGFDLEEGLDARSVANLILDNFDPLTYEISNLKINKLIYYAHGFYGARFGKRLIRNHVEAWSHGPVVKVVYDSFKRNGNASIANRATYFDFVDGKEVVAAYSQLNLEQADFILKVVGHYVRFSASQLVTMTHEVGSPWHQTMHNLENPTLRDRIPDEWIRNFFVDNYGARSGH